MEFKKLNENYILHYDFGDDYHDADFDYEVPESALIDIIREKYSIEELIEILEYLEVEFPPEYNNEEYDQEDIIMELVGDNLDAFEDDCNFHDEFESEAYEQYKD